MSLEKRLHGRITGFSLSFSLDVPSKDELWLRQSRTLFSRDLTFLSSSIYRPKWLFSFLILSSFNTSFHPAKQNSWDFLPFCKKREKKGWWSSTRIQLGHLTIWMEGVRVSERKAEKTPTSFELLTAFSFDLTSSSFQLLPLSYSSCFHFISISLFP